MFPVTITIHNKHQLSAVMQALDTPAVVESQAKQEAPAAKKSAPAPAAVSNPIPAAAPASAPTTAPAEGNAAAGNSTQEAPAASTASSSAPAASPEVSFDALKKAFLALSTKEGGRAKCESVLKPFGLAKLSEAKPEQYAAVMAAIEKAAS